MDWDKLVQIIVNGTTLGSVYALVAIGLIVAVACLNLATMLLARGATRAREISIRLAIGASRGTMRRVSRNFILPWSS